MTDQNQTFEQLADMQRQAFEPMRAFGGYAVNTFEGFMRENLAVMGDCVDYALAQAKMAGQAKDVNDYVGQQMNQGRSFSEKMAEHVQHVRQPGRYRHAGSHRGGPGRNQQGREDRQNRLTQR